MRETKSTLDSERWRIKESQKVVCGKWHFDVLKMDFDVVTKLSEVAI